MLPKKTIYFDNNASTPIDPRVLEAVVRDLTESMGNPSSIHELGKLSRQKLNASRQTIATVLGVKPQEIVFTSGGTEGANFVLRGLFSLQNSGHIITSDVEHSAVYDTVKYLERQGCTATYLNAGLAGGVTPEAVKKALQSKTRLISLMAVNNETGVKTDIDAIAAIAKEARIPFIVDGVAWLGKELFVIPEGVSAMFFSGHKFHAPKGVGFAIVRSNLKLEPLLLGGAQESGRRAGTENLSAIIGLAEAVRLLKQELPAATDRMKNMRDSFERGIMEKISGVKVNGRGPRICNTSNLCFLGVEGETLLTTLDMAGIAVSHGSACASGALEPSRVLLNMGLPRDEAAASLRFSFSRYTTQEEIDICIETVVSLVNRLR